MRRAATLLFALGVALAVVGLLSLLYLTFLAHLPDRPDTATGYVVQLDVPGGRHFVTEPQAWVSERVPFMGITIGLAGVILRRLGEARARRGANGRRGGGRQAGG